MLPIADVFKMVEPRQTTSALGPALLIDTDISVLVRECAEQEMDTSSLRGNKEHPAVVDTDFAAIPERYGGLVPVRFPERDAASQCRSGESIIRDADPAIFFSQGQQAPPVTMGESL